MISPQSRISLRLRPRRSKAKYVMADQLYLNLWFPSFTEAEMLPRLLSVIKQFSFSESLPGVGDLAIHPISFNEPEILEEQFDFRADPEQAILQAGEFV